MSKITIKVDPSAMPEEEASDFLKALKKTLEEKLPKDVTITEIKKETKES